MPLFAPKKEHEVQVLMKNLLNNNCEELESFVEGPRLEGRVRLAVIVMVIPVEKGRPVVEQAFAAVTKEFSSVGVALVVDEPVGVDEVILALRWERGMKYILAKAKHLNPMGAGYYQLGLQMTEMAYPGDYPELQSVRF